MFQYIQAPPRTLWFMPGLDHIFIQLGPAPPTPPSLPGLHARTCVGTLPHWEPM